jgi:hypothetical protein
MNLDVVFNIVIVVFTVSNLAAMGLELNLREALKTLRSARAIQNARQGSITGIQ